MAAEQLFKQNKYDDVTMVDIAKQAGVSKGTLYVYFATKEALFLEYASTEIQLFFSRLQHNLTAVSQPTGVNSVIHALRSAYKESEYMIRLLSVMHRVLESKAGFEMALEFRRNLVPLLERTGAELERHLPFLQHHQGKRVLLTIHGIALGLQQLSDPSAVIKKVEQQPDMAFYKFEFQNALLSTIESLLTGMETQNNKH